MGKGQEEVKTIVQLENYKRVAITEIQLEGHTDAVDGYKVFRRDKQGRQDSEVTLCVWECFDYPKLHDGDESIEYLWLRRAVQRTFGGHLQSSQSHPTRPTNHGVFAPNQACGHAVKSETMEKATSRGWGCRFESSCPAVGMEWNGMEWNGMEWNGMEWNGALPDSENAIEEAVNVQC
ncbi:hypothetical protein HGM15179_010270 [Zosterops borbonicus]|uniref:Uncharacterized protein n=1 Tax=Zosterops borbonicus TaxID=364589 RepID=A0A8K1GEQ1_9PASS|nr:hypothetical protein HGM15179_010270 [Zosterops borbonicus]